MKPTSPKRSSPTLQASGPRSLGHLPLVCVSQAWPAAQSPRSPELKTSTISAQRKLAFVQSLVHPSLQASKTRVQASLSRGFVERQASTSELSPNEIIRLRFGERSRLAGQSEHRATPATLTLGRLQPYSPQASASQLTGRICSSSRLLEAPGDHQRGCKPLRLRNPELSRLLRDIAFEPAPRELRNAQRPQPAIFALLQQPAQTRFKRFTKPRGRSPEQQAAVGSFYLKASLLGSKQPSTSRPVKSFRLSASLAGSSKLLLKKPVKTQRLDQK